MFEISYLQMFIIITVLWIAVRGIIAYKNKSISLDQEAKLILVYICLVVIARMVYFPFGLVDGHIGKLEFDGSKIMPLWLNVIPIVHLFDIYDGWQINIIGNITMFIPVGIVWPVCFKKLDTIGKTVLAGAGFTLLIEITQLPFYDRCSDIDDIILNTTGVLIGAIIYFGCTKKKRKAAGLMLLPLMLIGCGNTQPVQDTEDIALTEAPMEEEQVSPEEKTFDSLVKLDEGIYMMDCYTDYLVDEYLAENITETEQLDVWFTENLTQGVPTGDIPDTGCSSFAICDGDGNHLFGRNYDMVSGEALILRTMPEKGYKSIGIVDLMHLNIGSHGDYDLNDEAAKPLLLAAF